MMVALTRQPRRHARRSTTPSTRPPASRGPPGRATCPSRSTACCPRGTWRWAALAASRPARRRAPPRAQTGEGQLIQLALSDVAFAMVGNLGRIAEAQLGAQDQPQGRQLPLRRVRPRLRDRRRPPRDGRRADRPPVARARRGDRDRSRVRQHRGGHRPRPRHRDRPLSRRRDLIAAILRPWFAARTLAQVREAFAGTGVSWGPYQTFRQLVEEDPRCSPANPMFQEVEHPGVGRYLTPGSPLDFSAASGCRSAARRCWASTPTRSSPRCSDSVSARSARCTTRASWPGRCRRRPEGRAGLRARARR